METHRENSCGSFAGCELCDKALALLERVKESIMCEECGKEEYESRIAMLNSLVVKLTKQRDTAEQAVEDMQKIADSWQNLYGEAKAALAKALEALHD